MTNRWMMPLLNFLSAYIYTSLQNEIYDFVYCYKEKINEIKQKNFIFILFAIQNTWGQGDPCSPTTFAETVHRQKVKR